MRTRTAILVLVPAVVLGYLFYSPVPDDMEDKWHYRALMAGLNTGFLVAKLRNLIQPGEEIYYQTITSLNDVMMPAPDAKVPGSNVEARYTEIDGVRVLLYEPITKKKGLGPGLVFYHGGGYTIASTISHAPLTRKIAEELGIVVISVEYRLAPANRFPAWYEDCFAVTKWFLNHASDYGVDPTRVVLSGDSAGGHASAVISQHVYDDPSLPNIKLQVLFYPWMQMFDFNTPSYRNYDAMIGDDGLTPRSRMAAITSIVLFGKHDRQFIKLAQQNAHTSAAFKKSARYRKVLDPGIIHEKLKTDSGSSVEEGYLAGGNDTMWEEIKDLMLDPRLAPLFREDFSGLPAAFIATAGLDSLRDDGIFYARALQDAGVQVTWKNYEGAFHLIVAAGPVADIPTGNKITADAIDFIRDNV